MPLACLSHWYDSVLYIAPVAVIGTGLWIAGRRNPAVDDAWDESDDELLAVHAEAHETLSA